MFRTYSRLAVLCVLLLALAACGGTDDTADESPTTIPTANDTSDSNDLTDVDTAEEATELAQEMADDASESLEAQQAASGGGSASLTVGDMTWTFDSVLCAFGPEEIGQEGAELVLSSLQDGLQLYVSIDSFGHSVSLNDVADFQNPSVSLSAEKFTASLAGAPEEFVEVNGNEITSTALFVDGTTDDLEPIEGELTATCP